MDAKDEAETWAFFFCSIGRNPCRGCCMVLRLNFLGLIFLNPNEFGITGPKGYIASGQACLML